MGFQKNECVTVTIEDMGSDGEGIGKVDGFTLFVKDAVIGDTVEARIVKNKKHYAYARLERIITPSPFRAEPKCPYHRQCGGCQIQALSYEKQLEFKQRKIRNNLVRIGGFEEAFIDRIMEPIVGMENPYRYRNKAQYPVGTDKDGNVVTGFYAGRTHTIIPNTECYLGVEENREVLETVLAYMRRNHVSAYDEETGKGLVRHVLIRKGFTSGEIMVCLVVNLRMEDVTGASCERSKGDGEKKKGAEGEDFGRNVWGREISAGQVCMEEDSKVEDSKEEVTIEEACMGKGNAEDIEILPNQRELLEKLAQIPGMTSVSVSFNEEKTNVIMGREVLTLWGAPSISDTIHVRDMRREGYPFTGKELSFHISPLSFYQVNPVQTEKLYSLALEYAGLTGEETVWDLYCGIGTISLFLAGSAKMVYGVEVVPQAIEDARENARRNGVVNAEFIVGKAEEVLPRKFQEEGISADVIVVDPPRKGCDEACLRTILEMRPDRVVYVSCDSATLGRDLRVLCDGGYVVERVRGVDMFGGTVHCEVCVELCRK